MPEREFQRRFGGIYVDVALDASHKMLQSAQAGTRHIILFADAADAEQPGNYRDMITKFRAENITVISGSPGMSMNSGSME